MAGVVASKTENSAKTVSRRRASLPGNVMPLMASGWRDGAPFFRTKKNPRQFPAGGSFRGVQTIEIRSYAERER
jgi:hypothetical protein